MAAALAVAASVSPRWGSSGGATGRSAHGQKMEGTPWCDPNACCALTWLILDDRKRSHIRNCRRALPPMLYAEHVAPFLRFDEPLLNMLYAFGGRSHRHGSLDSVEMFDTWHGLWVPCPPMPARRAGASAAALSDGRLMVAGGYDERGIVDGLLDRVDEYDPRRRCWKAEGAASLRRARWGHGCACLGGLVYVVGGCSLQHRWREPREASMETLRSCEVYTPGDNMWRPAPSLQVARSGSRVVALGDRHLLAVGGCDDVFGRAETQPTVELFDPRSGHWAVLSKKLAQPRTTAGVAAIDDRRVMVFGGAPSLASAEIYAVPEDALGFGPRRDRQDEEDGEVGLIEEGRDDEAGEAGYRLVANMPVGRMGCQAAALYLPGPGASCPTNDRFCIAVVGGERCNTTPGEWPRVQQFSTVPVLDIKMRGWVSPDVCPIPPLPSPRTAVALCVGAGRIAAPPYATWASTSGKTDVDAEEEEAPTPQRLA